MLFKGWYIIRFTAIDTYNVGSGSISNLEYIMIFYVEADLYTCNHITFEKIGGNGIVTAYNSQGTIATSLDANGPRYTVEVLERY